MREGEDETMRKRLFLGIEGGATRTTGVLTDGELRVLARHVSGPSNVYAIGEEHAAGVLFDILLHLFSRGGFDRDNIVAGICIAGIRAEADRRAWRRILKKRCRFDVPAVLTHDAAAGLMAGSPDGTGVLVVCGTGSLAYARRADGAERFVGGRGPILGDEGSGFDIGHRALRAALRSADGRGPKSLLETLIPERLGLDGLDALVAWASPFAKDRVAGLAPIVFEAAEAGDAVARRIVEGAVAELAHAAEAAADALWPPPARPERVVLSGGVLMNQLAAREALASRIRAFAPEAACGPPEAEGAVGAVRLIRAKARTTNQETG
ncbi:MAG: hypothetical protein FJ291_27055 [Planctomycetes bacterium]|nr:hypothetical protein [Planctomycetota bacterium]